MYLLIDRAYLSISNASKCETAYPARSSATRPLQEGWLLYEEKHFGGVCRGNISPNLGSFKKDSHYGRVMKTLSYTETELLSVLDGEVKETFQQYIKACAESGELTEVDRFICGYRLGVLMTMEVFCGREDEVFVVVQE